MSLSRHTTPAGPFGASTLSNSVHRGWAYLPSPMPGGAAIRVSERVQDVSDGKEEGIGADRR